MMNDYKQNALNSLKLFFPYIEGCYEVCDFKRGIRQFNWVHKKCIETDAGLSRVAFIGSDFVIKYDYCPSADVGTCMDEYNFYQYAKQRGYAYLFAETTPVSYHGYTFFIMPKIGGIQRYEGWMEDYLKEEDKLFVCQHVEDRHNRNYGWKNNYPIMIDYAWNFLTNHPDSEEYSDFYSHSSQVSFY